MVTSPPPLGQNRQGRELEALTEVAKTLTAPLELPALLDAVMRKLTNVLEPAEMGALMLWDEVAGQFRAQAAFGFDLVALRQIELEAGESITGKVYETGQAWLMSTPAEVAQAMANLQPSNRAALTQAIASEKPPQSALAAPLRVGKRKLGVLVLQTVHRSTAFGPADLAVVQTLADLIALAIDRAWGVEEAAAIREERQAERLRSEVMATLSHELRTPLATIKGYTTALLLEEMIWPEDKRQEFLRLIDEECDNLQGMISEVLDSAVIDAGHMTIEYQPVRVARLAQELAEDLQRRTDHHRLVVDFPADFPVVDADPRRLKQVLRNILDNAVKYSPAGGLVIIRGEARPADVVVSVADQGVGISPEDLIPLFEKYFRVKSATGYHVAGTGLGLPVARAIVEAHGGRIWAESKLGQGTRLFFSLPRTQLSTPLEV
jgi:K+-sensing histidine kinase KdpD